MQYLVYNQNLSWCLFTWLTQNDESPFKRYLEGVMRRLCLAHFHRGSGHFFSWRLLAGIRFVWSVSLLVAGIVSR